ncbi:hypothetical protein HPB47_011256 [Ixodes persulcatus]|uniref:Uncharacterized protein n=1 Tax=Ixodes persulcatus TaxID=34615 RepID=A0AC60NX43_IXOPE|nr:hypothetical protein HPB47_011256 [Ixodes persulcatus]
MKSVRNKLQKDMPSSLVDINNCNLHKVHNAFAKGLDAFGSDVEEVVRNVYYYFKSAVRAEALGECQEPLGIASHVFLRHVSNRWLTLQDSLCRVLEQFEALKSYFHKASMTKQRVDTQNLHSKLAAAFSKKDLYAKVLFLKNCAELFSRFQTLFQKQEPLLHILQAELLSLVQRILSRCLRSAAYVDKSAEELKKLDVQDFTLWKTKPEVGMDTEQAMLKWDPGEKKRLLLGARAFYLACSKDLLQKLPLDNKVLQHTSLLGLQPSDVESEVRSLRYLASQLPQVLESDHVSSLVDEWHLLRCDSANSLQLMEDGRIDTRWATVFQEKCAAGQQKYPLLSRLVKALLSLPHGNADCERSFSENKHLLEGRASLCIASINGLRQVKTYLQRYDGDATKVPRTPDLLRSADMKRKKPDSAQVDADNSHDKRLKKQLEERVISCRVLLKRAEETIRAGLKCQSLEKVEGGQTMLAEANATFILTPKKSLRSNREEEIHLCCPHRHLRPRRAVCLVVPAPVRTKSRGWQSRECCSSSQGYYSLVEAFAKNVERLAHLTDLCSLLKKCNELQLQITEPQIEKVAVTGYRSFIGSHFHTNIRLTPPPPPFLYDALSLAPGAFQPCIKSYYVCCARCGPANRGGTDQRLMSVQLAGEVEEVRKGETVTKADMSSTQGAPRTDGHARGGTRAARPTLPLRDGQAVRYRRTRGTPFLPASASAPEASRRSGASGARAHEAPRWAVRGCCSRCTGTPAERASDPFVCRGWGHSRTGYILLGAITFARRRQTIINSSPHNSSSICFSFDAKRRITELICLDPKKWSALWHCKRLKDSAKSDRDRELLHTQSAVCVHFFVCRVLH